MSRKRVIAWVELQPDEPLSCPAGHPISPDHEPAPPFGVVRCRHRLNGSRQGGGERATCGLWVAVTHRANGIRRVASVCDADVHLWRGGKIPHVLHFLEMIGVIEFPERPAA